MGMTIWVNYLKDGKVKSDESDKSAMYRHLNKLDTLCLKLKVRKLSEFLDTTDLEDSFCDNSMTEQNTWERIAKLGNWFQPDEGIKVLSALIAELEKKTIRFGLISDNLSQVLADLIECRDSIKEAKNQTAQFHLCVVA